MSPGDPINPYEAPASAGSPSAVSGPGGFPPPLPWTPTEAIAYGWKLTMKNKMSILVFFVALLVGNLLSGVGSAINAVLGTHDDQDMRTAGLIIYIVSALISLPLGLWMQMGMIRYAIAAVRQRPEAGFPDLFSLASFGTFIVAGLLYGLAVGLGLLACLVPGIILICGWLLWSMLVIDRRAGIVESLKTSWQLTSGQRMNVFVLWLLIILVILAGYLACCVGVLVALPVIQFAMTYVYLKLTGEEPPRL